MEIEKLKGYQKEREELLEDVEHLLERKMEWEKYQEYLKNKKLHDKLRVELEEIMNNLQEYDSSGIDVADLYELKLIVREEDCE